MNNLNFGQALDLLKGGYKVARQGWNGKGMWLLLVNPHDYSFIKTYNDYLNQSKLPWIGMKTADDKFVPWLASQTDILAEDWKIVE